MTLSSHFFFNFPISPLCSLTRGKQVKCYPKRKKNKNKNGKDNLKQKEVIVMPQAEEIKGN